MIDYFVRTCSARGEFFDTVRGCFPEGTPIYEGSKFMSHTLTQIAVIHYACIEKLELVNYT